ncbi:MAG: hypothetical protein ACLUI3_14315 [Christensenellales bacterium]
MLYALCWVFIVLFGAYALMMLPGGDSAVQRVDARYGGDGGRLRRAVVLHQGSAQVEYEYTFTNGSLDFAVFRQAKRKELGSMNVKNVSACSHVAGGGFRRYLSMKDIEKKNWFCNRDGNLFYFYYVKENKKHMIVIEPSEEMVDMIRRYLPAGGLSGLKRISGVSGRAFFPGRKHDLSG